MLPRRMHITGITIASLLLLSCGPMQDSSSALVNLDGSVLVNRTQDINFALEETPNPNDPDAFKLLAASPHGMQVGSVRFCFGTLASCQAGTGISVAANSQSINGKTIYVSEKYIKIAAELQIHIFARNSSGQDMVQSYQIKTKGSITPPVAGSSGTVGTAGTGSQTPSEPSLAGATNECFGAPNDLVCQVELAVWRKTNEKRQSVGKQPFTFAKHIGCAARLWSVEMASRGRISHEWFSNGTLRRKYQGECQGKGRLSAENVAMSGGAGSDAEAIANQFVNMWWNSPGHKANMLGNHQSMGVGFARSGNAWYGTQNMGSE